MCRLAIPCILIHVNMGTMIGFLLGRAQAIRAVATNSASLYVGAILVLLTAIPRNYDQSYIAESSLWLVGPLVFSLISGSFLFGWLYYGFIRRHLNETKHPAPKNQWRCFMGLFWMTAPIAWLYALPVEGWFDSYHATQANICLLTLVSLWRVALMTRIISLIQRIAWPRALGWVLIPACLEVMMVVVVGSFVSPSFSKRIMAAMGGMRNAPEENLLLNTMGNVFLGSIIILIVGVIILSMRRFSGNTQPFPEQTLGRWPIPSLIGATVIWICVAVPAQKKQERFCEHARLVEGGHYRESIDYLADRQRQDFPNSRRLEPNPYEWGIFHRLPRVLSVLQPSDPLWVRELYLDYFKTLFYHHYFRGDPVQFAKAFMALENLPNGRAWVDQTRSELHRLQWMLESGGSENSKHDNFIARQSLTNSLKRLGYDIKTEMNPKER